MDKVYGKYFFNEFYDENGGGNYIDKEKWTPVFDSIADKIIENFNPKTVLDAGCALGYLVKALRDRNVEAYGIDISEYAVSNCDESIKEYVAVGSISEELPEKFPDSFDLIITIEVMEHLFPADGKKAIANLCRHTDTIIFTSTPDDIDDRTHCNVQQCEYWAKEFAENSFYHDLLLSVDFICPWALLFRKQDSVPDVIFNYEMNRRIDMQRQNRKAECLASIYFDCGEGFSEENKLSVTYRGAELKTGRVMLPAGCRAIRFDPVEDRFALVRRVLFAGNTGQLRLSPVNACYQRGDASLFDTTDPQYLSKQFQGVQWIEINCEIISFADSASFDVVKSLVKTKNVRG